jgi:hypothetical protein
MPEGLSYDEWPWQFRPIAGGAGPGIGGDAGGDGGGEAASGADGGGGDATGGDGGDGGEGGGGEGTQPDVRTAIDNLSERMDTFMQTVQPQQEDPLDFLYEDEGDDFEDDTSNEGGDDGGEADDLVRSADQIVENLVEQKVQERMAPHLQQQYEERRHEQVVQLENKYPELAEQDNATPLLQQAVQLAKQLGEPELAREAPFLETVHLRMKAEAARAEETSGEAEQDAPIEGAGGSGNSGSGGNAEKQAQDLIVSASKSRGIF